MNDPQGEQLALVQQALPAQRGRAEHGELATSDPVAEVVIDTALAHLDRPVEYAGPGDMAETALPGVRVRVRFAGRDHHGFVLQRRAAPRHPGALTPLRRVVSPEVVLTPHIHRVARAVADHYAGSLADVLRLAVPPRHAQAERSVSDPSGSRGADPEVGRVEEPWRPYPAGLALLRRLAEGQPPSASVLALPGCSDDRGWPAALAS
ncbi:MAG: primosome assembly protein PriA, partial [Ornithinimicrobium sp.]